MKSLIKVMTLTIALSLVAIQCDAGMDSWWKGMWGGKGKGKGRKRGGQYRPIYITAPPIYHHPHPKHHHHFTPHMIKPQTFGGYGAMSTYGGHDLHSFGAIGGHNFHGAAFGPDQIGSGVVSYQESHADIHTVPTIQISDVGGHSSSYGQTTHGFGPIKQDDLIVPGSNTIHSSSAGYGNQASSKTIHSSSYGNQGGAENVHSGSFGNQGGGQNIHSVSYAVEEGAPVLQEQFSETAVTTFGDNLDIRKELSTGGNNEINDNSVENNSFEKRRQLFDLEAPPSFSASIDENTINEGRSFNTDQSDDKGASPLPMAQHGTSSVTYLDESPAPLYPLHRSSEGRLFNPSKQIPFPDSELGKRVSQLISTQSSSSSQKSSVRHQDTIQSASSQGSLSYNSPSSDTDPIIEIVFQEAEPDYSQQQLQIDQSSYNQENSDDVEVYFIEVSDDETYESIDDLDLSGALAGVKQEFPDGLPSELKRTLLNSGYLDNAQIQVLELDDALSDDTLDSSLKNALRGAYGSSSSKIETFVKPDAPVETKKNTRLRRLLDDKNTIYGKGRAARKYTRKSRNEQIVPVPVVQRQDKSSNASAKHLKTAESESNWSHGKWSPLKVSSS